MTPPAPPGANPIHIARDIRGTASTRNGAVHFVPDADDPQITNPPSYQPLGGMTPSGNAGVRLVRTALDVAGRSRKARLGDSGGIRVPEFFGPAEAVRFDNAYTNMLPSLNLRPDASDELLFRLSSSRTLTRPEFTSLAPAFAIANATSRLATSGNPGLSPYLADNIDAGVEWHFDDASALWATAFFKHVDGYGQWDFSADYEVAGDVFVFFEAINLTDAREVTHSDWTGLAAGASRPSPTCP